MDQIKSNQADPGFKELLAQCTPADFDGHTEFRNMSPEKRLDALASLARFVQENKGAANRNIS